MTEREQERGLSDEERQEQQATALPNREALSVVDPTAGGVEAVTRPEVAGGAGAAAPVAMPSSADSADPTAADPTAAKLTPGDARQP
jgi:hypothetical protein